MTVLESFRRDLCWNFPYLALGVGGDVQPWLVFFEYRQGKFWIAGLGIDE